MKFERYSAIRSFEYLEWDLRPGAGQDCKERRQPRSLKPTWWIRRTPAGRPAVVRRCFYDDGDGDWICDAVSNDWTATWECNSNWASCWPSCRATTSIWPFSPVWPICRQLPSRNPLLVSASFPSAPQLPAVNSTSDFHPALNVSNQFIYLSSNHSNHCKTTILFDKPLTDWDREANCEGMGLSLGRGTT